MAITLKQTISFDIGSIVDAAIQGAREEKSKQAAKVEADFQKAIANGDMSYDAQIEFRNKQLEDENKSTLIDENIISSINDSIKSTKKLKRFNDYRKKYAVSLADTQAGRITVLQHLDMLKQQLNESSDPDLQLEIQGEIATAEQDAKSYDDAILSNQIKLAQNDGTKAVLDDAIVKVQNKRALASLKGNEEEVSAYDNTLVVLKSQINKVKIEDTLNSLQVKGISKGLGAYDKVSAINQEIQTADGTSPITIDGKKYSSAQDYWVQLRDGYLAGNGTGMFSNFFNELDSAYADKINAAIARDGFATATTLDSIKKDFDEIKQKPEYQPYLNKINDLQSSALGAAFKSTASTILDRAEYTTDYKAADDALQGYETTYGIDAAQYRLKLQVGITNQAIAASGGDMNIAKKMVSDTGVKGITTPEKTFVIPNPTPPAPTPAVPGSTLGDISAPPTSGGSTRVVKNGDTLSGIAAQAGMKLQDVLNLNPELKANPNLIRPGQSIKLAQGAAGTSITPTEKPPVNTATPPANNPAVKPPVVTPTSTPAPATPAAPLPANAPAAVVPPKKTITVRAGETLSAIAQRELGSVARWKEITNETGQAYNDATAKKLQIGTKLVIPI